MRDILIGLAICFSLYSSFCYLNFKNKKSKKNIEKKDYVDEKQEINKDDKSTQTENAVDKDVVNSVLDEIITSVEKESKNKKPTVSFDEDFEVIQ